MKRTLIVICILASAILFMRSADAALVTFGYSGSYSSKNNFSSIDFSGATVKGTFTFETGTANTSGSPTTEGFYSDALTQLSGTVVYGGGSFHYSAIDGNMLINDGFLSGGLYRDLFRIFATNANSDGVTDDLAGYEIISFTFEERLSAATNPGYITSIGLPLVPPAMFDSPVITLAFDGGNKLYFRDISMAPIPEPGMMMLVGSGLVGLAGWGRRRFKK